MSAIRSLWRGPWPWVATALVLAAYAVAQRFLAPEAARDPRPIGTAEDILALRDRRDLNVLFVLIDTLRAERLSSYGYHRPTSPVIDLLAAQGVRFAHHLSQSSWTKCSMASLWTGLYPQRSGVTRFDDVLPDEALMPAEILKEAGFRTAGSVAQRLGRGLFRLRPGLRHLHAAQRLPASRRAAPRESHRGSARHRPGPRAQRGGVPECERGRALVPLSPPHGRARVHLRRGRAPGSAPRTRTSTTTPSCS